MVPGYKKPFVLLAFALFLCSAFAEEKYFVCISSFVYERNADALVARLSQKDIRSFKSEAVVAGRTFYRVLVGTGEDEIGSARGLRDSLLQSGILSDLNLSGAFWACKAESPYTEPEPSETAGPKEIPLTGNNELPTSEEKPYSVLINSYSEERKAENDNERLHEKEVDSYIVKKYDEEKLFKFDLHAGAFETPGETEALQEDLSELGIENTEVADYNEFSALIDEYEKRIQEQPVMTDTGGEKVPASFSESVKVCLNQFPVNSDFDIKEISILDFDAARRHGSDFGIQDSFDEMLNTIDITGAINAASFAFYKDDLYGKDVGVFIFDSQSGAFKDIADILAQSETGTDFAKEEYELPYGILQCIMFQDGSSHYMVGATEDGKLGLVMAADDFTREEFTAFLTNSKSDSSFLTYPQIRRTLFIMPDDLPENMEFVAYTLSKVGEDYVMEKDYADWAQAIKGHWSAECYYSLGGEDLTIGFFDLDYDYNAARVHGVFMSEKTTDETSHSSDVNDVTGWFLANFWGDELSFAKKAYIVHVNSHMSSTLTEEDLSNVALMLQIWSGGGNTGIPDAAAE